MKVAVYAICKNEAAFVDRWMDSMNEADVIVVLDTGSEDDTVKRLAERGAQVATEIITPWRFDTARNRSLELVPEDVDVCVCTDLDEVFEPGWRKKLEESWIPGATQARYRYTWSFESDGREGLTFWIEKCHARHGYHWIHPVHEVVVWNGSEKEGLKIFLEGVQLNHHPDPLKSRAQYLPLLELSVKEDPEDDRNVHYLGREYLYKGRYEDCIQTLKRHLSMKTALWEDERSASMRYIAKAYLNLNGPEQAKIWYLRAIAEAPHLREPYMDFAKLLYGQKNWDGIVYLVSQALSISSRPRTYICEGEAWGSLPFDLRSLAYFYTGRKKEALSDAMQAASMSPNDSRLQKNIELIKNSNDF